MKNTEILKELDTLKTELNGRIYSFKQKYEDSIKPRFEVGSYYIGHDGSFKVLIKFKSISKKDIDDNFYHIEYYYGIIGESWKTNEYIANNAIHNSLRLATPQEVQEALTKEAVKKYQGKYFKPTNVKNKVEFRAGFIGYDVSENKLLSNNYSVFQNGTWAEIISEPKTIETIGEDLKHGTSAFIKNYLTENKSEIIETLKNL